MDGAGRRRVGGSRCEQARAKRKRQDSVAVGSGSMVRAAENSSVRARSCRALASAGGSGAQGVAEAGTAMAQGSGMAEVGRVNTK